MKRECIHKGFSLLELIFVIVIIGILSSVAIPKFTHLKDNAKITAELSTAASVQSALESCHGEWVVNEGNFTCGYSIAADELNADGYPPIAALGSSDASPLDRLLKNASHIGWSKDSSGYLYGPASDASKGTTHCKENKPCIGKHWEYSESNGTLILH